MQVMIIQQGVVLRYIYYHALSAWQRVFGCFSELGFLPYILQRWRRKCLCLLFLKSILLFAAVAIPSSQAPQESLRFMHILTIIP